MRTNKDQHTSPVEPDPEAILAQIFGTQPTVPKKSDIVCETDWLAATDISPMLFFIQHRMTRRKSLLFGVALCRRIWHQLSDRRLRELVEVAERVADGDVPESELDRAAQAVSDPAAGTWTGTCWEAVTNLAWKNPPCAAANGVAKYASMAFCGDDNIVFTQEGRAIREPERAAYPGLLRDIYGPLPFRPLAVNPRWRTSEVLAFARGVYQDRAFDRLPVFADALMDAGCDSEDIIAHCRGYSPHVRGCWVVDLVLGRE